MPEIGNPTSNDTLDMCLSASFPNTYRKDVPGSPVVKTSYRRAYNYLPEHMPPQDIYDPAQPTIGIVPESSQHGAYTLALEARRQRNQDPDAPCPNIIFLPRLHPLDAIARDTSGKTVLVTDHFGYVNPDYEIEYCTLPPDQKAAVHLLDISSGHIDTLRHFGIAGHGLSLLTDVDALSIGTDKYSVVGISEKSGVRVPHTVVIDQDMDPDLVWQTLNSLRPEGKSYYDKLVIKSRHGSRGEEITFTESGKPDEVMQQALEQTRKQGAIVVQEFITSAPLIIDQQRTEWNIRALTFGSYIGSCVRQIPYGVPISYALESDALDTEATFRKVWGARLADTAYQAMIDSADRIGQLIGHNMTGLDFIMEAGTSEPVLLEVNCGYVGGLGDIAELYRGNAIRALKPARLILEYVSNTYESSVVAPEANPAPAESCDATDITNDISYISAGLTSLPGKIFDNPDAAPYIEDIVSEIDSIVRRLDAQFPPTKRENLKLWLTTCSCYWNARKFDKAEQILVGLKRYWPKNADVNYRLEILAKARKRLSEQQA